MPTNESPIQQAAALFRRLTKLNDKHAKKLADVQRADILAEYSADVRKLAGVP